MPSQGLMRCAGSRSIGRAPSFSSRVKQPCRLANCVVFASLKAYWRADLRERKLLSMALPLIGLVLIAYVLYGSVYPVPAAPVNFFPYIVLCYFAVVVTFSLIRHRRTNVVDLPVSSMEMGVLQHVAEAD